MFSKPESSAVSRKMGFAIFSTLLAMVLLFLVLPSQTFAAVGDYPKLGMWWPNNDAQSVASRARYDWILFQNSDADHIAEIRAANPNEKILGSSNARELNYRLGNYNDPLNAEVRSAATEWMLTQAGSTLTSSVSNSATNLYVGDTSRFRAGEVALVDHELVVINSIGSGYLSVSRGQITPAAAHSAGARIASTVQAWPGAIEYDVTPNCPKVDVGYGLESWSDWNVRRAKRVLASANWDGLLIDCMDGSPSWMVQVGMARSIDQARTNIVPSSYTAFDNSWNTGMQSYGTALRNGVGPTPIIIGNMAVKNFSISGRNFETFPTSGMALENWTWAVIGPYPSGTPWPAASYLDWTNNGATYSTIETYEYDGDPPSGAGWTYGGFPPAGFTPNYQKMRYGLCSALLGNGYFSYEISTSGHGTRGLLWFDEYDNAGAGRGYLGQPTGVATQQNGGVWRRDYAGGISLVNPTFSPVTVQLGGTFKKIKGTQAPSVNDGSLVTQVTLQSHDGIVLLRNSVVPPTNYTLTYLAGSGGIVSGSTVQTVVSGGSGTAVTAIANTGYHFVNWSDGNTNAIRTDTNVLTSKTVTANFAANTYTFSYAAGTNGTITGTSNQTVNYGANGSSVTAVANTGYHFVNWSDGSTANPRTDTNASRNISVTANFAANTYTLNYSAGSGGTITGTAVQTVNYNGSGTTVTAVANSGYHFVSWSDGLTTASRIDAGVTANKNVTANFAANQFSLTYTAGLGGTISGSAYQTVNYNGTGTAVTAVANSGYHFVNWSDGLTSATRTDAAVTANKAVTANFAVDTATTTFIISTSAGAGGAISPISPTVTAGASQTFTITASTGYHIEAVFVDGINQGVVNSYTFNNVSANHTISATFTLDATTVPTNVALTSKSSTVPYGSAFYVRGNLKGNNIGLAGQTVILQMGNSDKNTRDTNIMAVTDTLGNFTFTTVPTTKTYYRVRYAGNGKYLSYGPTGAIYAFPKKYISAPLAPTTMYTTSYATVSGYTSPAPTTTLVHIHKQKLVNGRWADAGYATASVTQLSDTSTFSKKMKLAARGKWRLRTHVPAVAGEPSLWSTDYDYVTVK